MSRVFEIYFTIFRKRHIIYLTD